MLCALTNFICSGSASLPLLPIVTKKISIGTCVCFICLFLVREGEGKCRMWGGESSHTCFLCAVGSYRLLQYWNTHHLNMTEVHGDAGNHACTKNRTLSWASYSFFQSVLHLLYIDNLNFIILHCEYNPFFLNNGVHTLPLCYPLHLLRHCLHIFLWS